MFGVSAGFRTISRGSSIPRTLNVPNIRPSLPVRCAPIQKFAVYSRSTIKNSVQTKYRSIHTSPSSFMTYTKFFKPLNKMYPKYSLSEDQNKGMEKDFWIAMACFIGFLPLSYYFTFLEKDELTGRWRSIDTNPYVEGIFAEAMSRGLTELHYEKILPPDDPTHKKVEDVVKRLLQSAAIIPQNRFTDSFKKGILSRSSTPLPSSRVIDCRTMENPPDVEWEVFVIKDESEEVVVFPNGKIFVHTGVLPICKDEEGLAAVISHELGHVITRHAAERKFGFLLVFTLDLLSQNVFRTGTYLSSRYHNHCENLPYSRRCEIEADDIGLILMTFACFDTSKVPEVWNRIHEGKEKKSYQFGSYEMSKLHPISSERIQGMNAWLLMRKKVLQKLNCPSPSTISDFNFLSSSIDASPTPSSEPSSIIAPPSLQ